MPDSIQYKTEYLISTIQTLSLVRSIEEIRDVVKHAAREIAGSDGATFIMREADQCYYVDEYAIGPLWKGKKFPLNACISGWAMLNKQSVMIEDIYQDARIPHDAYRPTFVKSLLMVPVRTTNPIAAIGNYWQSHHQSSANEISLLEALANSTSIAIENVTLYSELENRVKERTAQLNATNQELEAFSYSVSHDLRAPLRIISGFTDMLLDDPSNSFGPDSKKHIDRIQKRIQRMNELIDDLLTLSKITGFELNITKVNLSKLSEEILNELTQNHFHHPIFWHIEKDLILEADKKLLRILLENVLTNACKFTSTIPKGKITIGKKEKDNQLFFYIKDNGVGFDAQHEEHLFRPFKRFHSEKEFPGTGIGLATVNRIVQLHGGKIFIESAVNKGTTLYFSFKG